MRRRTSTAFGLILAVLLGGFYLYRNMQPVIAPTPVEQVATTPVVATTTPAITYPVSFRVLDTGTHAAGVSVRKNYAVRSQAALAELWKVSHGEGTVPVVDFSKEYVIAVFSGQRPTGGHSIKVTSVADKAGTRTVGVTLTLPGEGCMVTQALTNPYQLIAVPVSALPLAHSDTKEVTSCR